MTAGTPHRGAAAKPWSWPSVPGAVRRSRRAFGRLAWSELGPARMQMIERAVELERSLSEQVPWALSPGFVHGMFLFALDRIDEARVNSRTCYSAPSLWETGSDRSTSCARRGRAPGRELGEKAAPTRRNEGARPDGLESCGGPGEPPPARLSRHTWETRRDAVRAGEHASRLARADGIHLCLVRSEFALGLLRLAGRRAVRSTTCCPWSRLRGRQLVPVRRARSRPRPRR